MKRYLLSHDDKRHIDVGEGIKLRRSVGPVRWTHERVLKKILGSGKDMAAALCRGTLQTFSYSDQLQIIRKHIYNG